MVENRRKKRTVPAGFGSAGACLLREACLLGSFRTTGLAGDVSCEYLHVDSRNNQPLVFVLILQPLAMIIHWSHRVGSSIKEEHSLAYADLPQSRKVPYLWYLLSLVMARETENREDDLTLYELD